MGQYLAGPAEPEETILYADLDMEELIDARYRQDITGHYNRFDVVSLNYNGAKYAPIRFNTDPAGNGKDIAAANHSERPGES